MTDTKTTIDPIDLSMGNDRPRDVRYPEGGKVDPGLMERVARKAGVDLGGNVLKPQPHHRDTSFSLTTISRPRARPAFTTALVSNSVGLEDMMQAAERGRDQLNSEIDTAENTILSLEKLLSDWHDHYAALTGEAHERGLQIGLLRRSIRDLEDQQIASRRAAEDSVDR